MCWNELCELIVRVWFFGGRTICGIPWFILYRLCSDGYSGSGVVVDGTYPKVISLQVVHDDILFIVDLSCTEYFHTHHFLCILAGSWLASKPLHDRGVAKSSSPRLY